MTNYNEMDEFYDYANYLYDENLSYGAKCMLTILLHQEANQVWDLYEIFGDESRENVDNFFQELLERKYVIRNKKNNHFVPFTHPFDQLLEK